MSQYISVPFSYGTLRGQDDLGPVHDFTNEKVVYKQLSTGGGESVYTVSSSCGAAGSAMIDVPSLSRPGPDIEGGFPIGRHCWLMYAPPIVIHDQYMSVMQGFNHINMVHRTSGYTPPVPNKFALNSMLGAIA